jgi:5,10-methylenetetrahydromethanopterin reductase
VTDVEYGAFLIPSGVRETVAHVRLAEELGLGFAGIADSHMLWSEVWVSLAAAAAATSRIRLGTWVTNPLTRHPTVTAGCLCTLDELSDGRAFLGIGYGDSAVKTIGLRSSRLRELPEAVSAIRRLVDGETVDTAEGSWSLGSARPGVPVYWAGDGPRQLRDAGRYADGVIANGWLVPEALEWWKGHALAGAAESGRKVELIFNTGISVDEDGDRARDAAKPYLARALCHDVSAFVPEWTRTKVDEFRRQYDYYHHIHAEHRLAELVPDGLVTRKAVAGTPEECAELLSGVIAAGYDKIALLALGDVPQTLRLLGERVLPAVRRSAATAEV